MMKSIIIRVLILLIIVSVPAYFIYKDYLASHIYSVGGNQSGVSAATSSVQVPVVVAPGSQPSKPNADILAAALPNLDKSWAIPDTLPGDAKTIIGNQIADVTKSLKANNEQYDKWIQLGNLRKLIGDYSEAKNIWEFAAKVWPDDLVAYNNLGDLYGYYLKDKTAAEKNMLKVTDIDRRYTPEYISLSNFYRQAYSQSDPRAINILLTGLNANPESTDIMVALASVYRDDGDKTNAKKYYEMALAKAKNLNNQTLVNAIETELSNL